MLVTNGQFVDDLLKEDADVNTILHLLLLSTVLLKKYGKLLFVEEVLSALKIESVDLYYFLSLLKISKKNKLFDMKAIASLIKKKVNGYDKQFKIISDSKDHYKGIQSFLDNKFDHLQVEYQIVDGVEVFVSGEGWYYKRGIEQDVKKVLGL